MGPAESLALVRAATERVLAAASGLSGADLAAPSRLPGWTRGHVLTHLARNADGLVNLLEWARTGEPRYMYASQERRNADIEAGSGRSTEELRADLIRTDEAFQTAAEPVTDWSAVVARDPSAAPMPAARVPLLRLGELEIHHVDLDVGYGFDRWSVDWVTAYLPSACAGLADRASESLALRATDVDADMTAGDAPVRTVEGPARSLLAWVTGRHNGHDLRMAPDGPLPHLGTWR